MLEDVSLEVERFAWLPLFALDLGFGLLTGNASF